MKSSRSEKSLSLLCQKFLSYYPASVDSNQKIIIHLDNMAEILEVERRRIYDIVNVLESVEILSRFCKNQYIWHGYDQIGFTLAKLKTLSVKSNFLNYTKTLMASQLESTSPNLDMTPCSSSSSLALEQDFDGQAGFELHKSSSSSSSSTSSSSSFSMSSSSSFERNCNHNGVKVEMKDASTQTINVSREEKSLGIMSQKFLMLFLTSQDGLVSINFAARVLLGDTKNDTTELGRFKTKIRRLYDIASVLTSIGLIKKYHFTDVNISKPAYMYVGPNVDIIREAENVVDFQNSGNPQSNSKHSLFDHFKRKLNMECNIPTFDVNTGILASKKAKISSSNASLSHRSSVTSIEKSSNEETTAKAQNENVVNLGIVKQERIEIEERFQEDQQNIHINPTYQSSIESNNDNSQYYSTHEQYAQQYYHYNQVDQGYNSNYTYNHLNTNIYNNENNLTTNNINGQLFYQRYYHQTPQYNAQVQTGYYNTEYNENQQHKLDYNCGQNLNQESRTPLVIDESPSTWAYSREEVNLAEQVEKSLTSASTLTSTMTSSENNLPSISTFLD